MNVSKSKLEALIKELPDQVDIEELVYHLYLLKKGQVLSHRRTGERFSEKTMTDKSAKNHNKIMVRCPCGRELILDCVGGQYQKKKQKKCKCGREWVLTEISELFAEIDNC